MNETRLLEMENFIECRLRENINKLQCCFSDFYRENRPFKFLPGHRLQIQVLSEKLREYRSNNVQISGQNPDLEEYSVFLKELIASFKYNFGKIPTQHRYSEIIKYVSTYIFMLGGKKCYEILSSNLPIPKTPSISKFPHSYPYKKLYCNECNYFQYKIQN